MPSSSRAGRAGAWSRPDRPWSWSVGALALTGVLGEPADPSALRWHVLRWDPWFLLRDVLLVVAALTRRRFDRTR
ncbi:hypothetical protein [Geodermatophilus sp. URMC 60]